MKLYAPIPQRVFFTLMSAFLVQQSFNLTNLFFSGENFGWGAQLFFAALINLFITGVFAFGVFALPIEKFLPTAYYKINNPKNLKHWFGKLGVERFRAFLLATFWKKKEMQKGYFDGTTEGLKIFEIKTKKSEFGHLMPFIILTILCILLVKTQQWYLIVFTMFINIIFNFYPIPLQRHHRMRLARMKKILEYKNRKTKAS